MGIRNQTETEPKSDKNLKWTNWSKKNLTHPKKNLHGPRRAK